VLNNTQLAQDAAAMAITSYKIDEIAAYTALSQVYDDVDEEGWPVEPHAVP